MSPQSTELVILIPSFNEWAALELLLERLDRVEFPAGWQVSAVIVDDASTLGLPEGWPGMAGKSLKSLEILHLRCNLGHQRAIAIGLYHVNEFMNAAAVHRARLPRRLLPLARGPRLAGESKMNFVSLLMHGLNAISVFSDQVSARLLTATAAFALVTGCVGTLGPIGCRVAGERLPGWLPFAVAALLVMALQTLAFATVFVFTVANRRSATGFILQRDAPYFILGKTTIRERPQLEKLSRALAAWSRVEVQQNPGGNA